MPESPSKTGEKKEFEKVTKDEGIESWSSILSCSCVHGVFSIVIGGCPGCRIIELDMSGMK